jgi:uncharacterized protein YegP (UPF0339 family)
MRMIMRANAETKQPEKKRPGQTHFEVFVDRRGDFRFRYKSSAGETVFNSEPYGSKSEALRAIEDIRLNAGGASIQGKRPTLIDHILSGPTWPEEMYEVVNQRNKSPGRPPIKF